MVILEKDNMHRPYVQKNIIISKANIGTFKRPEWHREYRDAHVNKIMVSIKRGNHPSENLTINEISKKNRRMINGNHRIEAISRIIKESPEFQIEMSMSIYSQLNKDEEIEIYSRVNNTRRETNLDRIKAHCIDSPIMKMIAQRFPFRVIYRSPAAKEVNVISVGTLFAGYAAKDMRTVSISGARLIDAIKSMEEKDYDRLVKFASTFKSIFGEPHANNVYSSYNLFSAISKVYFNYVGIELTQEKFVEKMKRLIVRHTADLIMLNRGIHNQEPLYEFILRQVGTERKPLLRQANLKQE